MVSFICDLIPTKKISLEIEMQTNVENISSDAQNRHAAAPEKKIHLKFDIVQNAFSVKMIWIEQNTMIKQI